MELKEVKELNKKEIYKDIEKMMNNKESLYKEIQEQIDLLICNSKVAEPFFYILLMEVCFKKMAQNVSKDVYFDTIETSANEVRFAEDEQQFN